MSFEDNSIDEMNKCLSKLCVSVKKVMGITTKKHP
jgi:hypothetical protein